MGLNQINTRLRNVEQTNVINSLSFVNLYTDCTSLTDDFLSLMISSHDMEGDREFAESRNLRPNPEKEIL